MERARAILEGQQLYNELQEERSRTETSIGEHKQWLLEAHERLETKTSHHTFRIRQNEEATDELEKTREQNAQQRYATQQ